MASNQDMQIGHVDQGMEGKESEVPRRDEFGELNEGDASNMQAQQQGRANSGNNQERSGNNIRPAGNIVHNQPQENFVANQGAHANEGRHDGQGGDDGLGRNFSGRGGSSAQRGRGGGDANRGGNSVVGAYGRN